MNQDLGTTIIIMLLSLLVINNNIGGFEMEHDAGTIALSRFNNINDC